MVFGMYWREFAQYTEYTVTFLPWLTKPNREYYMEGWPMARHEAIYAIFITTDILRTAMVLHKFILLCRFGLGCLWLIPIIRAKQ